METFGSVETIFNVAGKKALVTGGTRGLGRAMVLCLLENGCDVFVAARKIDENDELIPYAQGLGRNAYIHACDITKPDDVVALVAAAKEKMGRIDILINTAGVNILKPLTEMDDASFETVMKTNVLANFTVVREVAKVMKEQQYGKVINFSSVRSMLGASNIGYIAYATSKSAVNMLTRQAACELAADHITVNAIAPTFIRTAMNAALLDKPEFRKSMEERIPVGRIGEFKDLMGLMLLLSSDASQFITGQVFMLDGGISARQ